MPANAKTEQGLERLPAHNDRIDPAHKLSKFEVIPLGNGYIAQPVQATICRGLLAIKTRSNVAHCAFYITGSTELPRGRHPLLDCASFRCI